MMLYSFIDHMDYKESHDIHYVDEWHLADILMTTKYHPNPTNDAYFAVWVLSAAFLSNQNFIPTE